MRVSNIYRFFNGTNVEQFNAGAKIQCFNEYNYLFILWTYITDNNYNCIICILYIWNNFLLRMIYFMSWNILFINIIIAKIIIKVCVKLYCAIVLYYSLLINNINVLPFFDDEISKIKVFLVFALRKTNNIYLSHFCKFVFC